jgi:hypothetical protein
LRKSSTASTVQREASLSKRSLSAHASSRTDLAEAADTTLLQAAQCHTEATSQVSGATAPSVHLEQSNDPP